LLALVEPFGADTFARSAADAGFDLQLVETVTDLFARLRERMWAATEYALHQALARFLNGRTTLIIAHRLSAVKQADRVLVFDGGSIAEDGDHQQLIAVGGLYAKLYGHLQN
jgi:ABC-type transport system involved in Fe-S cluster assembly fused permease/ATPase subunit